MHCVVLPCRDWIVSQVCTSEFDIDFKKELVDLHGSILVTIQCVELRHRSQKDEINIISRQKYPQTPKKRRDLPPHWHLLVVNLILFYRFDVIIEFSISLLFFYYFIFYIFIFFYRDRDLFLFLLFPFAVVSVPIVYNHRSSCWQDFCHLPFRSSSFFFLLLTQSTPTSPPFHASIPSAPLMMIDTSQVRSKPIDLGCRRDLEGRKKN